VRRCGAPPPPMLGLMMGLAMVIMMVLPGSSWWV
jgi:hypothetical protein